MTRDTDSDSDSEVAPDVLETQSRSMSVMTYVERASESNTPRECRGVSLGSKEEANEWHALTSFCISLLIKLISMKN